MATLHLPHYALPHLPPPPLTHHYPRRIKVLWRDAVMVTDPEAVATICGRGEGSLDKAAAMYFPINQMCEPAGHTNLLTSPSDAQWKAVRKAVAAAFSVHHIKAKFPVVVASVDELVRRIRALGPQASVDVDQVCGGGGGRG
jgi:cytochrome P450